MYLIYYTHIILYINVVHLHIWHILLNWNETFGTNLIIQSDIEHFNREMEFNFESEKKNTLHTFHKLYILYTWYTLNKLQPIYALYTLHT